MLRASHSALIKNAAAELGFMHCGIAKAERLDAEAKQLEDWLNQNHHGKMQYMENYFDLRIDPTLLVPDSKSVISLTYNYFPSQHQHSERPKLSKYAYGKDYHYVIKDKLKVLLNRIQEEIGEVHGRAFVDSAPVLEKTWAQRAGMGWIGKHTNLINKQNGSFFFLAELIIDLELEYDPSFQTDHCGTCTQCIDACPTDAIYEPFKLDASKCISYLTIELRDAIPNEFQHKMEGWAFGCDICQDVCPWNRFSRPHQEPAFEPSQELMDWTDHDWHELTEDVFKKVFKGSAIKRTKFSGLKRNLDFIKNN